MKINYKRMEQMRNSGKTLREVAEFFGVSHQAVAMRERRLKEQGYCAKCLRPWPIVRNGNGGAPR